ncbi:MAG: GNAT family N-acetyltransferase [Burkholderiales bacterium]|jgi:ribosomal protein S18 acetylase RimI-like enzyme|nr:GNAT family N-acetyltransferase [Burkholderiales bacterium]
MAGRRSPARAAGTKARRTGAAVPPDAVKVRRAKPDDFAAVVGIDARVTGLAKPAYWQDVFRRYGRGAAAGRQFLVAEAGGKVAGFVIGEVRDWEFGSPPCGWVFGIDVDPDRRQDGIGSRLFEEIGRGFRQAGVTVIRTMLSRDNALVLSFFRSHGMMAAPFIPLEIELA